MCRSKGRHLRHRLLCYGVEVVVKEKQSKNIEEGRAMYCVVEVV